MSGVGDSVGDSSGWQRMRDGVALACFFISGSVGLAYEVCWIRKSALAFGVTTFAVSTVLAAFFGGLALGSFLFGRYSRRTVRPLKVYAILEIALGGIGLLSPPAFRAADAFFGVMYPLLQGSFVWLSLTRFVLIVILLLPPTILMGATLPLFVVTSFQGKAGFRFPSDCCTAGTRLAPPSVALPAVSF